MILSSVNVFLLVILPVVVAVNLSPPRFNAIHRNVTVSVGETAVLPCTVKSLGNFKIVWMSPDSKTLTLADRRITGDERVSLERPYINEWNLHVREVAMKDTGIYMCQINTDPVQVRPVQLIVQQPAIIDDRLSSPEEVKVNEGDTVQLVCNVTGFPTPEVTWLRIPKGLSNDEDDQKKKNIGAKGEVLMIHNVSRYCDDDYECVAFNGVQPADKRRMRVRVQFPPEVRLPNKRIGQLLKGYTILECEVTAFPQSITSWRYNGVEIRGEDGKYTTELYAEGGNKITLTLKIDALVEKDFGDYECFSENFLGHDSEIMSLYQYYQKKTTTTTTTTTTPIPWRGDRYDGDNRDMDNDNNNNYNYNNHYGDRQNNMDHNGYDDRDNGGGLNSYNTYNNGRGSQMQLRKNNENVNDNNDGNGDVQSVISDPNSSTSRGPHAVFWTVVILTVFTSIFSTLMR